jgi:hypothetical protein
MGTPTDSPRFNSPATSTHAPRTNPRSDFSGKLDQYSCGSTCSAPTSCAHQRVSCGVERREERFGGVEVLQLDLALQLSTKSTDLLNESARLMLLRGAEECPILPRWL